MTISQLPAANRRPILATTLLLFVGLVSMTAHAQVREVPFLGNAAGIAPESGSTICSSALDSVGDGCPATQASFGTALQAVWTDKFGNIYVPDYSNYRLRVIYHGGAPLANVIAANNPTLSGSAQVGYVYSIGGGATAVLSTTYCNGVSGTKPLLTDGDGCPAYQAFIHPVGGDTTADGDVVFRDNGYNTVIRVIYGGGAAMAALLKIETGITAPVVGSVYRIGDTSTGSIGYDGTGGLASSAHFNNPHSLAIDASGNIYIAETGANVVRMINGTTGIVSLVAGGNVSGCTTGALSSNKCPAGYGGDQGPATSATLNGPYEVAVDNSGNVFIADSGNLVVRVVYAGGSVPGLSSPTVGDIYTIAGGGSSTASGVAASTVKFTLPRGVSLDPFGNIYVTDYSGNKIWRIEASTDVANVFAGGGNATTVSAYCSGSAGPKAIDTDGDGCPALQGTLSSPISRVVFDLDNVGYVADIGHSQVRSFAFNQHFGSTTVGSSAVLPVAFTSSSSFAGPSISGGVQNGTGSDFSASPINCVTGSSYAANTVCVYSLTFAPSLPGSRIGELKNVSGTSEVDRGLDGQGVGSLLTISPGTVTKFASSVVKPTSITTDLLGNTYISDASTGTVWKGTVGGTFAAVVTGLNNPTQTAIDGVGNLYLADTGNNRIVEQSTTGVATILVSGLSSPMGVVSTGEGVLYIADTGNNRIISYNKSRTSVIATTGLNAPSALALDPSGTLYIADSGNNRIVTLNGTTQSSISAGSLTFQPVGLAVDASSGVYFADKLSGSVYSLPVGSLSPLTIATNLASPGGIAVDTYGDVYFSDAGVPGAQVANEQLATLAFPPTNMGESSAALSATLSNIGNASLTLNNPWFSASGDTAQFTVSSSATGCGTSALVPGTSCALNAVFNPSTTGNSTDNVTFLGSLSNIGTTKLVLTGTGVNLIKTTTAFTLSSPTSGNVVYGQTAIFNVNVSPTTTTAALTGTITLLVDGVANQTITLSATSAQVQLNLAAGVHVLSATYSGDNVYGSSHGTYSLTVARQPTTTTLTYTTQFAATPPTLTLNAKTIPSISGLPTGTITFYNGTSSLGTVTLSAQGTASLTTANTTYPAYGFSAVYAGDANYANSTSANVQLSGDFAMLPSATTLQTTPGVPIATTVTFISYFNFTGTLKLSCSGLPVNAVCRFQPTTTTLMSGGTVVETVQIFTDISSISTSSAGLRGAWATLALMFLSVLIFFKPSGANSRRILSKLKLASVFVAGLFCCGEFMGCGESGKYASQQTPTGTSTVTLTADDGAGTKHTVTYTLILGN